jgi:hypothetical protein
MPLSLLQSHANYRYRFHFIRDFFFCPVTKFFHVIFILSLIFSHIPEGKSTAGNKDSTGSIAVSLNYDKGAEEVWARMVDTGFTVTMPFEKQFWVSSLSQTIFLLFIGFTCRIISIHFIPSHPPPLPKI